MHCRPGGVAVFVPDRTAETFEAEHRPRGHATRPTAAGCATSTGCWDPDPGDSWVLTEYAFLLRDADGSVRVVHETHRTGLFGRDVWLRLLAAAGFEPSAVTEETTEDRTPRELFVGHRPSP